MNVVSFDRIMRDLFPQAGERVKQWVVDRRRERAWELETCPKIFMYNHVDNTGALCRNAATQVAWCDLEHDCCSLCCDFKEHTRYKDAVIDWLFERGKRPPVCTDYEKLSDEIEPNRALEPNPFFSFTKRDK